MLYIVRRFIVGAAFAMLALPFVSFGQTNVGEVIEGTISDIVQEKFESETGLDKIKNIGDIDAGTIADKTVEYIRGDVPSPLMGNLIKQLKGENGEGLESSFKLYLTKTQNRNVPYFTENACERLANQKLMEGLFNAKVKAHFSPWVDIAWDAIKAIASGGATIGDLVAEHTKSKAEELIKETLFGKAPPEVEIVTIPHYDSCGSITTITWDPINMRIIVVTSGNCGCKLITSKFENESDTLEAFSVTLVAPVTVEEVRINEETRFGGYLGEWVGKTYDIEARYTVGKLEVHTEANCTCTADDGLTEPDDDPGFFAGIINWIVGLFDSSVPKPEDGSGSDSDDGPTGETGETSDDTSGLIGSPSDGALTDPTPSHSTGSAGDSVTPDNSGDDSGSTDPDAIPTFACGDPVAVDGKTVATYPYRPEEDGGVNFSCNNSCSTSQVCTVLPESVGAFRDSCVYCRDEDPVPEEPTDEPVPPVSTGGASSCESAIRSLLDIELGWFEPNLSFSSGGATFIVEEHRCLPDDDFRQFHSGLIDETIGNYRASCPNLAHVSSVERLVGGTAGTKSATCVSETVFSF